MNLQDKKLRVLAALMSDKLEYSGAEIEAATKLWSGSLYPILLDLERDGLIVSRWDTEVRYSARPRRRLYSITEAGATAAAKPAGGVQ